ncbi:hypothetical protein JXO52_05280 [bacterium]|nr:hypothetical protein [bacterium]
MNAIADIFKDKTFCINALLFFICSSIVHFLLMNAVFAKESLLRTVSLTIPASIAWSFAFTSLKQNRLPLKKLILYSLALIVILSVVSKLIMTIVFN